MSFTQDELQAFNSILDQRLSAQRRDLERVFDQRINVLKYDFELRLASLEQSLARGLAPRFAEQQLRLRETLDQRLQIQQARLAQLLEEEHGQLLQKQQSQFEDVVERALAAQLLAIEQLITQYEVEEEPSHPYSDEFPSAFQDELPAQTIESIEVQTEIPWDDVADMFSQALDERMTHLNSSLQSSIQRMEQHVLALVRGLPHEEGSFSPSQNHTSAPAQSLQEVLSGIEQLEHIVELVQVAMTANHAFLSNRLFHHQHLPLERAHPHQPPSAPSSDPLSMPGLHSDLSFSGETENVP